MGRQITLTENWGRHLWFFTYFSFMDVEPRNCRFQKWTLHPSCVSPAGLLNSGGLESVRQIFYLKGLEELFPTLLACLRYRAAKAWVPPGGRTVWRTSGGWGERKIPMVEMGLAEIRYVPDADSIAAWRIHPFPSCTARVCSDLLRPRGGFPSTLSFLCFSLYTSLFFLNYTFSRTSTLFCF